MFFYIILDDDILKDFDKRRNQIVLTLAFEKYRFSIVTKFPRAESSFGNVFIPFDVWTWALILASCIVITLVIQFNWDMRNLPKSKAEYSSSGI